MLSFELDLVAFSADGPAAHKLAADGGREDAEDSLCKEDQDLDGQDRLGKAWNEMADDSFVLSQPIIQTLLCWSRQK
jgi:hypothetical protein